MKVEFLDYQYSRGDVTCTAAIHCNQMIGIRRMSVVILNVIWTYRYSEESFSGHNFCRST